MNDLPLLINISGYIALVGGAVLVLFSRTKTNNLKDLKDRVGILENERKELKELLVDERERAQAEHLANQKAIAKLEGQVALYRDLKLQSIAEHLETIDKSNNEILNTLKGSAIIAEQASKEGGLLVKTRKSNPLDVKVK